MVTACLRIHLLAPPPGPSIAQHHKISSTAVSTAFHSHMEAALLNTTPPVTRKVATVSVSLGHNTCPEANALESSWRRLYGSSNCCIGIGRKEFCELVNGASVDHSLVARCQSPKDFVYQVIELMIFISRWMKRVSCSCNKESRCRLYDCGTLHEACSQGSLYQPTDLSIIFCVHGLGAV